MMRIFLGGGDGAGKSTTAQVLQNLFEERENKLLPIFAFGNLVRVVVSGQTGIPLHQLRTKPTPPNIRTLLRNTGEGLRQSNPYHWVQGFELLYGGLEQYIVDDLRFEAEAMYAVATDGYLVYLEGERQDDPTFKELDRVKKLAHLVVHEPKSMTPHDLGRHIFRQLKSHYPTSKPTSYSFKPLEAYLHR